MENHPTRMAKYPSTGHQWLHRFHASKNRRRAETNRRSIHELNNNFFPFFVIFYHFFFLKSLPLKRFHDFIVLNWIIYNNNLHNVSFNLNIKWEIPRFVKLKKIDRSNTFYGRLYITIILSSQKRQF